MPNMKNAKKAVKTIAKKNVRNNDYKASMKTAIKNVEKAVFAKDKDGIACDGVKIFLGGKATTKILEARQLSKAIPLKKAQEVVKNLIEIYKNERIDDETFENFDTRVLSNLTVEEIQSKIGL